MLSKVFSGHSFYHACRYIVNKPGAEVLECEGVRGHDYRLMAEDFILQQQLRPQKEKACFHCSLSFYPGEILSNETMAKIAKEYLEKLNITETQFAITKHTDRRHVHLHIVANMVNNNGKAITDSYLGLRGKKLAQQLTQQYKLVPALSKKLELTNYQALRQSEANKYTVYKAIMDSLPRCKTMQDLEKKLQQQGIETQYKYKGQTTEKQGVSFKIGEYSFKGSKVDRKFSLSNLEKIIAINQKQLLKPRHETSLFIRTNSNQNSSFSSQSLTTSVTKNISESIEKVAEILLKPEQNFQQTPIALLKENKQRKKKRGLHQ
ncbi:MAG: relaxase/mobilization nuclease domain-containing protein [Segetibacter sp.]